MGKRKDFETTDQAHEFFDSLGLREHHTAKAQGYVSRKQYVLQYRIKDGSGKVINTFPPDMTVHIIAM